MCREHHQPNLHSGASSSSVDSPQRDNASHSDRKQLCRVSSRGQCESTSGGEVLDKPPAVSSTVRSSLGTEVGAVSVVVTAPAGVSPPLAGGRLDRPPSTVSPRLLVIPISPRRTTPPPPPHQTVAPRGLVPASVTAQDVRHDDHSEPLLSVELVACVVVGCACLLVLLALGVAAVCRYRSRQHGTYNVDAATVNGYAYEICTTTTSSAGSTSTIGGTRRKGRGAAAGASASSPCGSAAGGSLGGRKAGRTKKKVVREWYV